ncbi:hypothetical protein A2380_02425 [candidate division WWE3 bacterium RIFOXYB1_FULL_43_24]|uniref:Uncharacterized protein n=2 Tax=Katanobacteria TaxID=422282 RepID=A0A0G0YJW7_UNCKA|nr:MAG: hypothetical protein UU92_C0008G0010 [candidate division WWE3 bacterium GW2011_GWA1_42_12]KKS33747.1 MAG: hypothetical protein UU97_C0022G0009 [candidate division WWE3 bacterium GW2011_GWD1_42_14]KKS36909.1 MAG: hypothetical protein UV00_C0019G0010 [candidate division WWE3 bacterium GW2011_GWF1_42_14]KKS39782.1 MAG: hypothetical protein UV03_C0021G0009 [candidate division WWE3 bacterium GW2011_GWE1_42_16]KKS65914.1 MAG: hypothetical protein UV35_C0029G0003 [candidate division WWE3 bacte
MNAVQITTIIALIVLIIDATAITVFLVLFLKDLRTTAQDADKTLKDVRHITSAVGGPVAVAAGLLENVARGTKAFKIISSIFNKKEEE